MSKILRNEITTEINDIIKRDMKLARTIKGIEIEVETGSWLGNK